MSTESGRYSIRRAECALAAIMAVIAFFCAFAPALAAGTDTSVVVTADTLIADNRARTVTYDGDVRVVRGKVTLTADRVVIRLIESGGGGEKPSGSPEAMFSGKLEIDTIEAEGGVKVVQGDSTAVSERAVYKYGDDTIVMEGSPRVWQGSNVLTGTRIIYNIEDDTIRVDKARTVLYPDDGGLPVPGNGGGPGGK